MPNVAALAIFLTTFSMTQISHAENIMRMPAPIYKASKPEPQMPQPPGSCLNVLTENPSSSSGVYTISLKGKDVPVYCDMVSDGGGWTLVGRGVRDRVGAWATTRDAINPHINPGPSSGETYKLSDSDINLISKKSFKVITLGYNNTRYFKGGCIYNQLEAASGDCAVSYSGESWSSPRGNGQSGAGGCGLSDHRANVPDDGYFVLSSACVSKNAGWSAGNGTTRFHTGTGQAGTRITINIFVR